MKLPGLLELRSRPWNTILPEEIIRGLSTDTARGWCAAESAVRLLGFNATLDDAGTAGRE